MLCLLLRRAIRLFLGFSVGWIVVTACNEFAMPWVQSGPAELTTRWTMKMYFKLLPWQPEVVFTGLSIYGINPRTGRFKSHRDVWDSIQDNAYFSREGLLDLIREVPLWSLPTSCSPFQDLCIPPQGGLSVPAARPS